MIDLADSLASRSVLVRRRPKIVRVCGEVPEEVIDDARRIITDTMTYKSDTRRAMSALLSLVEESE